MKTHLFFGVLISFLFFPKLAFSQNTGNNNVVAIHIDKYDSYNDIERDIIQDVKISLLHALERNGFETVSIDNEDRVMSNLLNAINFRDAEVRSEKGKKIDYIYSIWIEAMDGNYKIYSKRQGRTNTDYKPGTAVDKEAPEEGADERLAHELNSLQNELIALQIAEQFIPLSSENRALLENGKKKEIQLKNNIQQIRIRIYKEQAAAKAKAKAETKSRRKSEMFLSIICPSSVHFINGKSTGGALLLTGELLSTGGGIYTYAKANSIVKTLKADDICRKRDDGSAMPDIERANLENQYHSYQVANYVCWGALAALYIVNVATSFKIVSDTYALVPSVQQNMLGEYAYGVTFAYKF